MTTANYFSRGHSRGRVKEAKWRSFSVLLLGRHTRYVLVAVDRMVPADSGWLWACNGSSEWSVCLCVRACVMYIRTYNMCLCTCTVLDT